MHFTKFLCMTIKSDSCEVNARKIIGSVVLEGITNNLRNVPHISPDMNQCNYFLP